MHNHNNIFLLGGSHVAKQSIENVNNATKIINPEIIALELDTNRLYSLEHNLPRPKNLELLKVLGLNGFLFYLIGEFLQKKIGKYMNIEPGSEMLTGLKYSRENNTELILIDRDIKITLQRFSKNFKKREVIKIFWDMAFGKPIKIDLSKVPDDEIIQIIINKTKDRYPSLYKILIDERDRFMAKRLFLVNKTNPSKKILAIVGAGHVPGILRYLKLFEENFK